MPDKPRKTSHSFSAFSSARDEADRHPCEMNPCSHTNADKSRGGAIVTPNEVTGLERRVLAHERILQALIGHLAEHDPEILRQLKVRFGTDHNLGQYEQNYVSTDDYGEHFIRSIEQEVARRKRREAGGSR